MEYATSVARFRANWPLWLMVPCQLLEEPLPAGIYLGDTVCVLCLLLDSLLTCHMAWLPTFLHEFTHPVTSCCCCPGFQGY